jgi:diguanylate cyclase (GGDEF)-like protein
MRRFSASTSKSLDDFWRTYVHIGVLTYSLGALVVLAYTAATPDGPHRLILWELSALSLLASVGPFRVLGLRLVATKWSEAFFTSWAALTFVFVGIGAALDGGIGSPICYFLILPMLFVGLAYSAGTVLFLTGFGMLVALVLGALTPDPSWSAMVYVGMAILIAGLITAAAARNRDRLMGQLIEAASVDALTGSLSRRAFYERLDQEAVWAWRYGTTFSLIEADVDNLKEHNDRSGHESGDRALRLLASVLGGVARQSDAVGRVGGDEFVMLLHGTDEADALGVAGRLQEALHAVGGSGAVTASIGVSTWLGDDDAPEAIVRRADEALYAAKRGGRDRAVQWEPAPAEPQAGLHWLGRRPRARGRALGAPV